LALELLGKGGTISTIAKTLKLDKHRTRYWIRSAQLHKRIPANACGRLLKLERKLAQERNQRRAVFRSMRKLLGRGATATSIARALGIKKGTVQFWIRRGEIPSRVRLPRDIQDRLSMLSKDLEEASQRREIVNHLVDELRRKRVPISEIARALGLNVGTAWRWVKYGSNSALPPDTEARLLEILKKYERAEGTIALAHEVNYQGVPGTSIGRVLEVAWTKSTTSWRGALPEDAQDRLLRLLDEYKQADASILISMLAGSTRTGTIARALEKSVYQHTVDGSQRSLTNAHLRKLGVRGFVIRSTRNQWFLSKRGLTEARYLARCREGEFMEHLPKEYARRLSPNDRPVFLTLLERIDSTVRKTYGGYCKLSKSLGRKPLSYRRFAAHLEKFEELGLIKTSTRLVGNQFGVQEATAVQLLKPIQTLLQNAPTGPDCLPLTPHLHEFPQSLAGEVDEN